MKQLTAFLLLLACFVGVSILTLPSAEAARYGGYRGGSSYKAPAVRRPVVVNKTVINRTTVIQRNNLNSSGSGSGGFLSGAVGGAVGAAGGVMLMEALKPDAPPAPEAQTGTVTPPVECPQGYVCSPSNQQ